LRNPDVRTIDASELAINDADCVIMAPLLQVSPCSLFCCHIFIAILQILLGKSSFLLM
jgi:hypothetical protein